MFVPVPHSFKVLRHALEHLETRLELLVDLFHDLFVHTIHVYRGVHTLTFFLIPVGEGFKQTIL